MFKSDFLEKFSKIHPIGPLLVWTPVIAALLYRSFAVYGHSVQAVLALGAIGFVSWTLAEYLLHRFVFHFENENRWVQRLHFIIHGNHHVDAQDPMRLVMPPAAAIIIAVALWALFRTFMSAATFEPFFALFLVGYLCYDYSHYAIHHFTPRTAFGRMVKDNHMKHHFVTPNARWGVSSPLWDYVFRSTGARQAQQKTPVAPVVGQMASGLRAPKKAETESPAAHQL